MTEHHGEFSDYDGMRQVLRRVAELRNISRSEIDRIAGIPSGWASKTLADVPIKRIGPSTLGPMMGALGIKFLAVDDFEAMAKYAERAEKRKYNVPMLTADEHPPIIFKLTTRRMRKLAKLATAARKHIPKRKRISIARKAARARWRGNRPVLTTTQPTENKNG